MKFKKSLLGYRNAIVSYIVTRNEYTDFFFENVYFYVCTICKHLKYYFWRHLVI